MNCGCKYISTYRHSESKVLNISYLQPDDMKDSKLSEIHIMHAIFLQVPILRQPNNKDIIMVCDVNCGSKYISTYRHPERKILNVSYEPPAIWEDSQIY